jgi:hypothetical protein
MCSRLKNDGHPPSRLNDRLQLSSADASNDASWPILFARTSLQSQGWVESLARRDLSRSPRRRPRCWLDHDTSPVSPTTDVQSNTRNRLRLCKRPCCPVCRAGHDMSRTGEPYLKTGDQASGLGPHAIVHRQQNRRVLLPFGPTSSCYRVEQ